MLASHAKRWCREPAFGSLLAVALAVALSPAALAADAPAVPPGPRGAVGPDVPLTEAEQARFAKRIAADGRTAAAVQAACDRAAKEGSPAVFLPAGEYVFEAEVRVPAGLTVLGEGAATLLRTSDKSTHLFSTGGDGVRFTRLRLRGADETAATDNDTFGISVSGSKNVRIDHCQLTGFSYATNFADAAVAQVDHCSIHHNLREGLGYGVAVYSGAHVLAADNEFAQNRHSLASNGALDWGSPKRLGKYVQKPGARKTHWEFLHNRVDPNDLSPNELCAVDTHPGMDGTFVVEDNVFERVRLGVGIRDGSGVIRGNVFRHLGTRTNFRPLLAISIGAGAHNNIPVEGCMPHDVIVEGNVFPAEGPKFEKVRLGKAENITIDGQLVPETKVDRPAPAAPPRLTIMNAPRPGLRQR